MRLYRLPAPPNNPSVSLLLIVLKLNLTKISFKWPYIFVCMCVSEKLCWLERDVWHASAAARI